MESREEPLTSKERAELQGYVSFGAAGFRLALFVPVMIVVALASRRIQLWLQLAEWLWLIPTVLIGTLLYVRSSRWTGGRALRGQIRADLQSGIAQVHYVRAEDAILFNENEDEGPVFAVLADTGETLLFTGQELARLVSKGFPWREFEIREAATSRRFLGLKRRGEPLPPSAIKPPLSIEQSRLLKVSSPGVWRVLDIPFEQLRTMA